MQTRRFRRKLGVTHVDGLDSPWFRVRCVKASGELLLDVMGWAQRDARVTEHVEQGRLSAENIRCSAMEETVEMGRHQLGTDRYEDF